MTASECRAFWVTAPGRSEIRTVPLPESEPDQALVRTRLSAISRGTESLVFHGHVPQSQYQAMRCPFQEGDFPGPVKYGYISVGDVERGAADWAGRRVFCLYPHQDLYVVPVDALLPIPDAVPDERAALAANLETAINGLWDGAPGIGDQVAVVGAGVVGLLAATLVARIPGVAVQVIDIDPTKAEVCDRLGLALTSPDGASDGADLVIHASGSPDGLDTALGIAGMEATVLELSWYGDKSVSVRLGADFHARRLTLKSSQVGRVPSQRRSRWTSRRRLALALDLLTDPVFDALIGGHSAFADLPATMARLAADPAGELCHIVRYD
ncbi:MAG: zinc-binding alcohol dehydrogenase [Alphaproteobacteria bacterium]|nr:zinc-binding alcohol dehydrogenase [Alphaproteobacteria bacterium]